MVVGTDPKIMIRYRDDGKSTWSNEKHVSLNRIGDTQFIARMFNQKIYRARQYEIAFTDNAPFVIVGAEENVFKLDDNKDKEGFQ